MGVSISVLVGDSDAQDFTVLQYRAEAGAPGPLPHFHRKATEWFHITEGQFTFEVDGEQIIGEPGATVLVPPEVVHCFHNTSETASSMTFGFNRSGMERYFDELFSFVKAQRVWPPAERSRLATIAERYDTFSPGRL